MRVLLTGADGQLGLDLADTFADDELTVTGRAQLDITSEAAVVAAITRLQPDVVINAAASTDVDGCEADPDRAHLVNGLGPWWLARACRQTGTALATYSTDYVFNGDTPLTAAGQPRAWTEFDPIDPINAYGRSKAAGEQLVRETLHEHYIIRTAWLCGARGHNFVRTMLRIGREKGVATVVDDQHGSPTFTRDLATATRQLVTSRRYGTYHLTNTGTCSWYDLAAATFDLAGLDVELHPASSNQLDRPAPRPAWSVLDNQHAQLTGLAPLPAWRDGLTNLLAELTEPA